MFIARASTSFASMGRRCLHIESTHIIPTGQYEKIVLMKVASDKPGKTDRAYQERCLQEISEKIASEIGGNVLLFSCTQSVIDSEQWKKDRVISPLYTGHAMMFYGVMAGGQLVLDPEMSVSFTKRGLQSHDVAIGRLFPGEDDEFDRKKYGSNAYIIAVPESATLLNKSILESRKQRVAEQSRDFNLSKNACIHAVHSVATDSTIEDVSTQLGLIQTLTSLVDDASSMNKQQKESLISAIKELKLNQKGDELGSIYQREKDLEGMELSERNYQNLRRQ